MLVDFQPPAPSDKCYKLVCRANDLYERHLYTDAAAEYTKAIHLSAHECTNEFLALLYSNRSACYWQAKHYANARDDANRVLEFWPTWAKVTLMKLRQFDEALTYYKRALEKDNRAMGLNIVQIMPGRDIAIKRNFHKPIQNRIYEFAQVMRNIIYIVADLETKHCVVVDAARQCWDIDGIFQIVEEYGYHIVAAAVTHYHFDHVGGSPPPPYDTLPIKIAGLANLLKRLPYIKAYVNPHDIPYIRQANPTIPANRLASTCSDVTETLEIGKTRIRFLPTPGHTPGSQSLLINDCRLLAGDTLLCGFCGRTDLHGGDKKVMEQTLRHTLGPLDDRVVVYPGHHYGSEWSTVGIERDKGCLGDDLVGYGTNNNIISSSASASHGASTHHANGSSTSLASKLSRSWSRNKRAAA
ncbi:beta-lactamase-like protein [Zychaea mexicana]|uniref:beta-lactamase-like protein n=1 Tax=Zychaea mexicana TaxID=64656 RepID=UPI0022FE3CA4|nr:beta-lactamase-like protein [Zychaea mexicana]KAI9498839.1 beta-lactamase-like protein [Zychaea mexicana]